MENKNLLVIIAVILTGILGVLLVQTNQEPDIYGEQIVEAIKKAGDKIGGDTKSN